MHLSVPPSHLKVAIVVFVKRFSGTRRSRRLGSSNLRSGSSTLTTVRMQADYDSLLNHVWTCLCVLPARGKKGQSYLTVGFINQSHTSCG